MAVAEALSGMKFFSELSNRELKCVSSLMTPVRVTANYVLAEEGTPGREFVIVSQGTATVRREGRVVAVLGPGDFFGEISLLAGRPRNASIVADTDMVVYALNRREFAAFLDQSPSLAKRVLLGAIKRLHELDDIVSEQVRGPDMLAAQAGRSGQARLEPAAA